MVWGGMMVERATRYITLLIMFPALVAYFAYRLWRWFLEG